MSNVKRYSPRITMTSEVGLPSYYAPVLTLDEHGPAVMHDDYAALQAKLAAVQAGADRLAEAAKHMDQCFGEDGYEFDKENEDALQKRPRSQEW